MPTIQEVTQDPEFKAWPREKQLYMLGKADPEFGTYEPEKQNYFIDKFVKDEHKPSPLTAETMGIKPKPVLGMEGPERQQIRSAPSAPEQGWLDKFWNGRDEQGAGLEDIVDNTARQKSLEALDKIHENDAPPERTRTDRFLAPFGVDRHNDSPPAMDMSILRTPVDMAQYAGHRLGRAFDEAADTNHDLPMRAARTSLSALPFIGDAGDRVGEGDYVGALGTLASAALPFVPKAAEATGNFLKRSSNRSMENVLLGGTSKAEIPRMKEVAAELNSGSHGDLRSSSYGDLNSKLQNQLSKRMGDTKIIDEVTLPNHENRAKDIARQFKELDETIEKNKNATPGSADHDRYLAAKEVRDNAMNTHHTQEVPGKPATEGMTLLDSRGGEIKVGGSPAEEASFIDKRTTGGDTLKRRQESGRTAKAKGNQFRKEGSSKTNAEGEAWKDYHQGTQANLEDITKELADNYEHAQRQAKRPSKAAVLEQYKDAVPGTVEHDLYTNALEDLPPLDNTFNSQRGGRNFSNKVSQDFVDKLKNYGNNNRAKSTLIDAQEFMGKQEPAGTMGLPKYVMSRLGSPFGVRNLLAEEASGVAKSVPYNTNMAYAKKIMADKLLAQGMSQAQANIVAGAILVNNQSQ